MLCLIFFFKMYIFFLKNIFLTLPLIGMSVCEAKLPEENDFEPTQNWPKYDHFGQISAVGVDSKGNVYVFHRGSRQWDYFSFDIKSNIFLNKDKGPIPNETIVVLDPVDGSVLKKTGENFFYLPHGLTVDDEQNIWVTDVAMHQVFKFPPIDLYNKKNNEWKEIFSLGVLFEPGNDDKHFCKPTGVAVDKFTKEFYVSDGYCNARIIKYDESGKKLLQWGRISKGFPQEDYILSVPHAVTLAQDKKILYVADREDFRVVAYDSELGKFKKTFAEELRSRIFSVAYSPVEGGLLYALANTSANTVAVYDTDTGKHLINFSLKNHLTSPHDLALSPDGKYCYIGELHHKLWKIRIDLPKITQILHHTSLEKAGVMYDKGIEEPVPAESKINKANNFEANSSFIVMGLVVIIVVISFLFFMFHYFKRKAGYRRYEARRLILDDDEGGIQLT